MGLCTDARERMWPKAMVVRIAKWLGWWGAWGAQGCDVVVVVVKCGEWWHMVTGEVGQGTKGDGRGRVVTGRRGRGKWGWVGRLFP